MQGETDYFKLTLAIAGGVVLGGLVLWIARIALSVGLISAIISGLHLTFNEAPASAVTRSASYQAAIQKQRTEAAAVSSAKRQREFQNDMERQKDQARRRRARTTQGEALWAKCEEWARNYKQTPTETIRLNGKFYCDRYDRFVETGDIAHDTAPVLETR